MPVAVVTGASAGIGRATVRRLADEGYDVGLLARGEVGLRATADEVRARGGSALMVPTDVAEWDGVDRAATQVEDQLGPIDVWVNNAMTTVFGAVEHVTAAEIRRATEVTYLGQVHGTLAALDRMRPRDRGRIVNVGSALAFVGIPLQAAYCGAKFAVRGFTESVRAELLADGSNVTISQVHLPAVNTPQFGWCESKMERKARPVPPIYEPEVAAEAIVRVARDGRREEIVGAWNGFLITVAQRAPGVVAHFAADTAVDSQQSDEPEKAHRPSNLWDPLDRDHDVGPRGSFTDTGGVLDPSFLLALPGVARDLVQAVGEQAFERARRLVQTGLGMAASATTDAEDQGGSSRVQHALDSS
jgi:short-subunit dehydrogenase